MTIRDDDPNKPKPEESEVGLRLPDDDPDVIAHKAAIEALAAEEAKAAEGENKDPVTLEAKADGENKDPPAEGEAISIPKARLDKVLADLEELKLENARLEGAAVAAAELAKHRPAEKPEEEKPQLTHEQVDGHFDKMIDDVDAKLDAAELTTAEWRKRTREIEKLRNETHDQLDAQIQPEEEAPSDSLAAAEATEKLVEGRPWIEKVTADEWEDIRPLAIKQLERENIKLGTDEQSTVLLRGAMVMVAERLGYPALYGAGTKESRPSGDKKPPEGGKAPPLKPEQVKDKLALASRQPALPETVAGADNQDVDPAAVLSEEDAMALPASARDRVMETILGTR